MSFSGEKEENKTKCLIKSNNNIPYTVKKH